MRCRYNGLSTYLFYKKCGIIIKIRKLILVIMDESRYVIYNFYSKVTYLQTVVAYVYFYFYLSLISIF
jgi:hypothetical protein